MPKITMQDGVANVETPVTRIDLTDVSRIASFKREDREDMIIVELEFTDGGSAVFNFNKEGKLIRGNVAAGRSLVNDEGVLTLLPKEGD